MNYIVTYGKIYGNIIVVRGGGNKMDNKPNQNKGNRTGIGCLAVIIGIILQIICFANDMDGLGFVFFFIWIISGIWVWLEFSEEERKNKLKKSIKLNDTLRSIKGFFISQEYFSENEAIAIDEKSNQICIIDSSRADVFLMKDILSVEIIEDGVQITETSRGSQLGGALLGGVLAGGVGAIIGGLSGSQVTSNKVKKVDLKIVVNDTLKPIFKLNFINELYPIEKDKKYHDAMEKANHWNSLISVLIKRADEEDKKSEKKVEMLIMFLSLMNF